jgi:hypothetical protein
VLLAVDLLSTAHGLRRSEWRVLEELLGLLPGGEAPLPRQLMALRDTDDRFYEACARVAYLGWTHPPQQGDA